MGEPPLYGTCVKRTPVCNWNSSIAIWEKLAGPNEPGERMIVHGKVYGADCRTPVRDALIEIWQANHAGRYDTDKPGKDEAFDADAALFTLEWSQLLPDLIHGLGGEHDFAAFGRAPIPGGHTRRRKMAAETLGINRGRGNNHF